MQHTSIQLSPSFITSRVIRKKNVPLVSCGYLMNLVDMFALLASSIHHEDLRSQLGILTPLYFLSDAP